MPNGDPRDGFVYPTLTRMIDSYSHGSILLAAGGINITGHVTVDEVKNDTVLSRVQKGGSYKPRDCQPVDRVAIIIPYRDRKEHLAIFLNYMHAFLQRQQLQYGIFVAELVSHFCFFKK